jgi:hypothetical protein
MAKGVNPTMNAVKASSFHAAPHGSLPYARSLELPNGDDPVLTSGNVRNDGIRSLRGAFPLHADG